MSGASSLLFTFTLDRGITWKVFSLSLYGVCVFDMMTSQFKFIFSFFSPHLHCWMRSKRMALI